MNKSKKIFFVGGGGHSLSCIDILEQYDHFKFVGFVDPLLDSPLGNLGYKRLGSDETLNFLISKYKNTFIAVGNVEISDKRKLLFNELKKLNANIVTLVSRSSHISKSATVCEGALIMSGSIINSRATIRENCIINTGSIIEHGSFIDKHVNISPSATILGNVFIGQQSFIGAGAIIREGVTIKEKTFVKAGEIVKSDIN